VGRYLAEPQLVHLKRLLVAFFSLPYSTDLDGKDAETLLKIAKGLDGTEKSKRKELFDIVHNKIGYSVKTLRKRRTCMRVDLQEQRFCDVKKLQEMHSSGEATPEKQGTLLLNYMKDRIESAMKKRGVKAARSLVLLKDWDKLKENYSFIYWEEDFWKFIHNLSERNQAGEIEWVVQGAGLHGRDKRLKNSEEKNVRLLRVHFKHNQIFTDHDIPKDAHRFDLKIKRRTWEEVSQLVGAEFDPGSGESKLTIDTTKRQIPTPPELKQKGS
jgi:hypothetical protein